MRILVLIHEYPPVGGGGGRVAQDLAEGLAARGHEITVLTSAFEDLPRTENRQGVRILRLPVARKEAFRASFLSMGLFVLGAVVKGWGLLRREQFDVIHAHFAVPAGAAAWALSLLTGVPYVLTAHLGDVPGGTPAKTSKWFRFVYPFTPPIWKRAAQAVAVSEFTRSLARRHYDVPIQVIPNGVDLEALRADRIEVHTPPRLVFAGRFVPQKNPLMVVKVLAQLQDLPWHCTMLGDGPLMPQVKEEIAQAGLESRFTLPGWVTPEEVLAEFSRSDILFMPSRSEGLPVVGVQALAKGLALVVGKVGGFVDLVNEGENGFAIADPEDAAAFERKLRHLLPHPQRLTAFRQASLQKAETFALPRILTAYEAIFHRVRGV